MSTLQASSNDPAVYAVSSDAADDAIIAQAKAILAKRVRTGTVFDSPSKVKDYLSLEIGSLEHEVFGVLFLDSQHRMIAFEQMFRGTLAQASVYPREIVKRALALNAGAVILTHNHPSGNPDPSRADEHLTSLLKSALALIDVRVLDHMIIGGASVFSFAERGLI
jgi:DNA repair protein RadC